MKGHTYIASLDELKTWFFTVKTPTWKLMQGFHDRTNNTNTVYTQKDESIDMEESWELLEQMISINSAGGQGGRFTIFVSTEANGKGRLVRVQIGNIESSWRAAAGLGSAPYMGMIPAEQVAKEVERERQIWEMRRELDDLRAAQDASAGIGEVLLEKVRELDLTPVIQGLLQMFQPRPMTIQGMPYDAPPSPAPAPSAGDEPDGYTYDGARLLPILDSIRDHFESDDEFFTFLDKLAKLFCANPGMYKSMVK